MKLTVAAARIAAPSLRPVSEATPEGISTLRTGGPPAAAAAAFAASISAAAAPAIGRDSPIPNSASIR